MTISDAAAVATAIGVLLAALQLFLNHRQSVTTFEDTLNHEYRKLAARIPTKALLGEDISVEEFAEHIDEFYHYFDLTNGQIFLRQIGRIRKKTWAFWRDGIRSNLERPAFRKAWQDISSRAGNDFEELRRLIDNGYKGDPRRWRGRLFISRDRSI